MNYVKKYGLLTAIVILIVISLVISTQKKKQDTGISLASDIEREQCFEYEKTIPASDEYPESVNREYIELAIDNDGLVSGRHDKSSSSLEAEQSLEIFGVTDGTFVNVFADDNGVKKQEIYNINGDNLYVGYQRVDVPQYESKKGVFMYEDINELTFYDKEFYLSRVTCRKQTQ